MNLADQLHLTAAEGFLELGLPLDANSEIENIEPKKMRSIALDDEDLRPLWAGI